MPFGIVSMLLCPLVPPYAAIDNVFHTTALADYIAASLPHSGVFSVVCNMSDKKPATQPEEQECEDLRLSRTAACKAFKDLLVHLELGLSQ